MQQIGRYVVIGELGRGGMGVVYEARDPLIGRVVAVKTINLAQIGDPQESEWVEERLLREARAAGALSHPGIVIIFDVGRHEGFAFIAMERVHGPTLQQLMASGPPLPKERVFDILRQTAAALDYAHESGVVHRDVKPANIMIHRGSTVKIADFGIAKANVTTAMTRTGMVLGTPSYMSPEQITTQPVDGRSDQFSLAVVAFEMLTGRKPFPGDSLASLVHQIVYEERPTASTIVPGLSRESDVALNRALSRLPDRRFENCSAFVAALELGLAAAPANLVTPEPQRPAAPSPTITLHSTPAPSVRSSRSGMWLAFFATITLAVGLIWIFRPKSPDAASPVPASRPSTVETPAVDAPKPPVTEPARKQLATAQKSERKVESKTANRRVEIPPSQPTGPPPQSVKPDPVRTEPIKSPESRQQPPPSPVTAPKTPVVEAPKPAGIDPPKAAPPPVVISEFVAEPATINHGDKATLRWRFSGVLAVEITPEIGAALPTGSRAVAPRVTTTYELVGFRDGRRVTARVTVNVRPPSLKKP